MEYDKVISDLIEQKEVLQKEIDSLKDLLRYWDEKKEEIIGKKIKLIQTTDQYTKLQPGSTGVINHVDDAGTIFADWEDGSNLGLIPGIDHFTVEGLE